EMYCEKRFSIFFSIPIPPHFCHPPLFPMHQETTALSAGGDRCGHGLFCRFSRERLPTRLNKLSAVCGLVALLGASALYGEEPEIVELEAFKVEHHRPTDATLSPLAR